MVEVVVGTVSIYSLLIVALENYLYDGSCCFLSALYLSIPFESMQFPIMH